MSGSPAADQAQRDRIENDLDTNLLVEAGAGSGKTRSLLNRLVALIRTGKANVGEIAAVTFTRKAAAELREGFQTTLEAEFRNARAHGGAAVDRVEAGREIDRVADALDAEDSDLNMPLADLFGRLERERSKLK